MTETAPVVPPPTLDPHSPSDAAQALQSLQDRPAEAQIVEAIKPSSKTLVELEGVTYKRCTHCKELKVRDQNFNKDKSRGDGYACTCKGCANRHTRAWHERHKQQNSVNNSGASMPPNAQCSHCKEYKLRAEFYGDTSQANGLRPHCRECERDVKRDRRKRKAAAEALTFASHGMNGSEGEAAGLLPAQQKPKRVRRRKSRDQIIQPIAVDLQAVPPEQAPGVLGIEVPHLQNTATAVQMATTAADQLAHIQAQQMGVVLDAAAQQQLALMAGKDGAAVDASNTAVVGEEGGAVVGGFLVGGAPALPASVWIQQPIPQPAETEYETASDATLDADLGEQGEVVSSVRRD
ncbi:hypothetical protein WJX82_009667 [Trebouxia sp. C0006]